MNKQEKEAAKRNVARRIDQLESRLRRFARKKRQLEKDLRLLSKLEVETNQLLGRLRSFRTSLEEKAKTKA